MSPRRFLAPIAALLTGERAARPFFAAHAQSALGTGAATVALLVLAYERLRSPWAIALILLADLAPAMALGPVLGAAADRWPRRRCMVVADVVRAAAFAGIALAPGFGAMLALALLAGLGTALYRPAVMAGLPSVVRDERHAAAATSLYGALEDLGYTLGPALAAALLVLAAPETVLLANAATFAVSALLLARVPFGSAPAAGDDTAQRTSLLGEAREGLRATAGLRSIRTLVLGSTAIVLFAGLINVGELLLARDELGAGPAGYAVLVAAFGLGVVAGSLAGARGGDVAGLQRRYLAGLLLTAASFCACGLAPGYGIAVLTFALGGVGNGLILVHERLLLQALVPDALMGRVFSVKDTLQSWAFAPGFLGAGLLASLLGPRLVFGLAGAGAGAVWWLTARALASSPSPAPALAPALADA